MFISELLTVITLFAILLPAAAMVREKERGTVLFSVLAYGAFADNFIENGLPHLLPKEVKGLDMTTGYI